MKVVVDTNVLVSGLIAPAGTCAQIIDLFIAGAFELTRDGRILDDYETVLRRPELDLPAAEVEDLLRFIRLVAERVTAMPVAVTLPDPSDLPFLEVAATSKVLLVTGNLRHFPGGERRGVKVINPKSL